MNVDFLINLIFPIRSNGKREQRQANGELRFKQKTERRLAADLSVTKIPAKAQIAEFRFKDSQPGGFKQPDYQTPGMSRRLTRVAYSE